MSASASAYTALSQEACTATATSIVGQTSDVLTYVQALAVAVQRWFPTSGYYSLVRCQIYRCSVSLWWLTPGACRCATCLTRLAALLS